MWEDGFCRNRVTECLNEIDGEDPVRKAFSKMSIQLYNYGEGWVLGRSFCLIFFLSCSPPDPTHPRKIVNLGKNCEEIVFLYVGL